MKKLIFIILTVALALVSCNKADRLEGETAVLEFNVSIPGAVTKAEIGKGELVDQLICAVFENGVEIAELRESITRTNGQFVYQPSLYVGKTYQIVFWAQNNGRYDTSDLTNITYKADRGYAANDETLDAFTLTQTVKLNKDKTVTVGTGEGAVTYTDGVSATLKRPFTKLRVGSYFNDWDENIKYSRVTFSTIQTHFNALTGDVVDGKTASDKKYSAEIGDYTFTVKEVDEHGNEVEVKYQAVSFNYLLPGSVANITVELAKEDFNSPDFDDDTDVVVVVTKDNVPSVGDNAILNLTGNILKGDLKYTVSIDPSFDEPDAEDKDKHNIAL